MVKIGVALSGCDLGGVSAYRVLEKLCEHGFELAMISTCCTPSLTALPYAYGCKKCEKLARRFLRDCKTSDLDSAITALSADFAVRGKKKSVPLAVNSVNVLDGKIITFTNDYRFETDRLSTFALRDTYDALSASISLVDGLSSYRYKDARLCDFSIWYGCPVYPLRMAGLACVVSVAFLPEKPRTLYEALGTRMIEATAPAADVHIKIVFPPDLTLEQYVDIATEEIEKCMDEIYRCTLP